MTKTKRTPIETTNKVSRKPGGMKQTGIYQKTLILSISGNDPEELKKVAHHIHVSGGQHPLVLGGKKKSKVYIQKIKSTKPKKIFDGLVG